MNGPLKRLWELRVEDAMSTDIVTIAAHSTMSEAARRLLQAQVSGAPVVDEQGRCVGVLSGGDFVKRDAQRSEGPEAALEFDPVQGYQVQSEANDLVCNQMSVAVQTIDPHLPLLEAARYMCLQHVHRLIAVDDSHRPIGVVSSLDLSAAVLKIIEEENQGHEPLPR
jgi:CBS domain-containing protein